VAWAAVPRLNRIFVRYACSFKKFCTAANAKHISPAMSAIVKLLSTPEKK
jgi:hypothetical protein